MSGGMMNAKPLAALTSGLLARKGGAKPAMRPQVFGGFGRPQEDLGWNDMGQDAPPPAPEPPVIVQQQQALERRLAPRAARAERGKAAFTLRLTEDRHLRLRLASAVRHRSSQQIVTEALDALLAQMPDLDDLVAQAKKRPAGKS